MPVQVQQEQLEPCRVALTIEVPPEEIQKAVQTVFNQVAKRTNVPGFRPGKAPLSLVKRYVDESRIQEMAFERALTNAYNDALKQAGVVPYSNADPKVELGEEEMDLEKGFSFKATVATQPSVELGDLEGLSARRIVTAISDEDVDREILRYREQSAAFATTEEAAADGDRVRGSITIQVEGDAEPEIDNQETLLQVGTNLEQFDEGLRGITAGEEKSFEFSYPDDFGDEERSGKKASVKVDAIEILRRTVPELDQAFAEQNGFETPEALRERVREMLEGQATSMADQEVNDALITEVVRRATVNFPEEMIEAEASDRLANMIRALERRNVTLEDYLQSEQKDVTQLQTELRAEAEETVRNTLVLLRLAQENELTVVQKDVDDEIKRRAEAENVKVSQMRRLLTDTGELDQIRNRLFLRKITIFLRGKAEVTDVAA
ncbi:MAG: trigger factor [Arthrobacter sp.]|nr:trigger factor [Arthrobacter sp.]